MSEETLRSKGDNLLYVVISFVLLSLLYGACVAWSINVSTFNACLIHINRFVGIYAALMPFSIHILVYAFFNIAFCISLKEQN